MSDTKVENHRIECPYCKDDFLTKTYSKHLLDKHKSEIFVNKHNKNNLTEVTNKKEGSWSIPIEVKLKDKSQFFVPCCNKFYTKESQARKHNKNKECRDIYVKNAKELVSQVAPITINNTHSGTGDIIINNTYNIVDLSGNIIKTFKKMNQIIDRKNVDTAYDKKIINKYKKALEENNIDINSEVSSVQSGYDSDSESETTAMRYDIAKEMPSLYKAFNKYGFDLSREGLELSTKEEHALKVKEQLEIRIEELECEYDTIKYAIKDAKENICFYEEKIKDQDYSEADKMKYKNKIINSQNNLDKARQIKEEIEEKLNTLRKK